MDNLRGGQPCYERSLGDNESYVRALRIGHVHHGRQPVVLCDRLRLRWRHGSDRCRDRDHQYGLRRLRGGPVLRGWVQPGGGVFGQHLG